MLMCRTCGQCIYLSDSPFYEINHTSGWERNTIDCESGEYIDFVDGDTSDSEHDRYECPHCDSADIEFDSQASEEDALAARELYTALQVNAEEENKKRLKKMEYERKQSNPDRLWDVNKNIIEEE